MNIIENKYICNMLTMRSVFSYLIKLQMKLIIKKSEKKDSEEKIPIYDILL